MEERLGKSEYRLIAIAMLLGLLAGLLLGTLTGLMIAELAPGYYRAVFNGGEDPTFNVYQAGLGAGASQGLAGGAILGLMLSLGVVLRHTTLPERGNRPRVGFLVWSTLITLFVLSPAFVTFLKELNRTPRVSVQQGPEVVRIGVILSDGIEVTALTKGRFYTELPEPVIVFPKTHRSIETRNLKWRDKWSDEEGIPEERHPVGVLNRLLGSTES